MLRFERADEVYRIRASVPVVQVEGSQVMKTVSRVSKYGVGKGDVQLEVLVGNGQLGASVVEGGDQEFEQVHDFKAVGTLELAISDSVFLSATAGQDAATETRPGGFLTLWGVSLQASQERKVSL